LSLFGILKQQAIRECNLLICIEKQEGELPFYPLEKSGDIEARLVNISCNRDGMGAK